MEEFPPEKYAYDMVLVDEWRGDRVMSQLCVRQFKAEGLRDDMFAGERQTRFSSSICWLLRVARISDCSSLTLVLHLCTLEQMSSIFWRLKAAVNGTRKASKHWQECSCDKLVANMLFQQNDISPCIYKRFCDNLDVEQHSDDFSGVWTNIQFGTVGR